ncbi:uncharacterized protein ACRADG_003619 [Cochliomyia hominivorax]
MKIYLVLSIIFVMLSTIQAKLHLPEISKKHGPLYQGIRLLILEEKENAETTWNETQRQIEENSDILHKALHYLHNYETIINDKLNEINNMEHAEEVKKCYKKYERQIARFNRDLLDNYFTCKQALNSSISQLKNEVMSEINYIHDAAAEILELKYICNVTDLKRIDRERHHATVTICVLSNLAEIKQNILEATQIALRILSRLLINQEEKIHIGEDDLIEKTINICLDYKYLRIEFETIYDSIMSCVKEIKK